MVGEGTARPALTPSGTTRERVPVLYLAPWVDVGGADKGTIDWFRFLDRSRFAASLITTQPSSNRRLGEVAAYAEEVWELPQLMRGDEFPRFISEFIQSRSIKLVHIMNSRLGFELLPTIVTLPDRPRVVVQLHVEEPDCSGYVRYVTTRYGNLVDGFSLSSEALSERVAAYEIPRVKRRVIRTGVDARREFNPARATPVEGLDASRLQIVFPARLDAQKDPLLMVDVAARLRSSEIPFQINVLGDGNLAASVRDRVASLGLEREVVMHGDSLAVASWYAACDVAILTSKFEGLPYVAYEAMAMEVPLVAPRLPGLDELVTPDTGFLVSPPRAPEAYAEALATLAADPALRTRMADAARTRVLEFSLERMANEHAELYEQLLTEGGRPRRHAGSGSNGRVYRKRSARVAFRGRRPGSRPLVSVIVPCFNHGTYLPECLASVSGQRYPRIEAIVVDDGSTDPDTHAVLDRIEHDRIASVIRLPTNGGPGAARNAAIERASGRYVLPLDADNMLFPSTIADLVEQLNNAGEQIGFIYPNLQFFGNRQDYFEAPSYNLHALLAGNYCDTASLIDREVFDHGLRYGEHPELIHEDWEFVLALAERGIYGQPARKPTLLFRKRGFTRSDLVNLASCSGEEETRARHAKLFARHERIKADWDPSLTVIVLDPVADSGADAVPELIAAANRQTYGDFELIIRTISEVPPTDLGPRLRRVPSALARSRAEALAQATKLARGRYVMATYGSLTTLLADRAIVEKVIRVLDGDGNLGAIGLADAGAAYPPLRLLHPADVNRATLHAFCWRLTEPGSSPAFDPLPADLPLETLARCLGFRTCAQWRHFARTDSCSPIPSQPPLSETPARSGHRVAIVLREPRHPRQTDARLRARSVSSGTGSAVAGKGRARDPWMPPQTRVLCRHLHEPSGRYTYSNSTDPPTRCRLSRVLGSVRSLLLPGTTPISLARDGSVLVGEAVSLDDDALLGFVEEVPLPLLDELSLGYHRRTGQWVLIAGASDPLADTVGDRLPIGFVEPYPIHPQGSPHIEASLELIGLVRTADLTARRHRYGAGRMPQGMFAGELGSLLCSPADDRDPLWIDEEGSCFALRHLLSNGRPSLITSLRWTAAPLTWTNFGRPTPKLRSSARRALDSTRLLTSASVRPQPPASPAGYLLRSPTTYTVPLYGALHPVTGDQMLSSSRSEAAGLGYREIVLLGHLVAWAPVTGRLGPIRAAAPWTTRFGMVELSA